MAKKLFIPTKIRVGFQERRDTFTNKLAYVIYFDEKNKIRKETSWLSWCDSKIPYIDFDNTPQDGFILNRGIQRYSDWGSGRSVIRIYDPRDFEFEITVDNLLGILMHSDVSKRDIQQSCIFAWSGPDLVLLPTNSEEYQSSVVYTAKQSNKVSTKELVPGYTYSKRKSDELLVYMGFYEYCTVSSYRGIEKKGKKHIFHNPKSKYDPYPIPSVSTLAECASDTIPDDFSFELEKLLNSPYCLIASDIVLDTDITFSDLGGRICVDTGIVVFPTSYTRAVVRPFAASDVPHVYEYLYFYTGHLRSAEGRDELCVALGNIQVGHIKYDPRIRSITGYNANRYDYGSPGYYGTRRNQASIDAWRSEFQIHCDSLGVDSSQLSCQEVFEILKAMKFGKLVYVYPNGTTSEVSQYQCWY
jgi:hypothetical protein